MDYEKPTERPEIGVFHGFDHIRFWVGNAKQAASFYCARFGFDYLAYQGLETGNRDYATHVVRQGGVIFAFTSPLNPEGHEEFDKHPNQPGNGGEEGGLPGGGAAGRCRPARGVGAP